MASSGIERFKESIPVVQEQLGILKEKLQGVLAVINEGKLVPDAMAESVAESLRTCKEKEAELRSVASELSIPVDDCSFDRIAELIEAAEKEQSLSGVREIVFDYFRLTTTAQNTLNALEESKKELQKVCQLIGDEFSEAFAPYSKVVEHARAQEDVGADYDLILNKLGKDIVRAADRVQLGIDADKDISEWLDGSCDLLKQVGEDESSDADEMIEAPVEETVEQTAVENDSVDGIEISDDDIKGIIGLPGIVNTAHGEVSVTILKDTPASDAHASKYLSKAKDPKHFIGMTFVLPYLMMMHLFPANKLEATDGLHGLMPAADVQYLLNQGYVGILGFDVDGEEQKYYVPSAKAYACMKKQAVASYVKSQMKNKTNFPKAEDLLSPSEWSPAFAYRCKMIIDHMVAIDGEYTLAAERAFPLVDYAFGFYPDKQGEMNTYISCLPGVDGEKEIIGITKSSIDGDNADYYFNFLVENMEELLAKAMDFSDGDLEAKNELRFAIVGDVKHFYDADGAIIENGENSKIENAVSVTVDDNPSEIVGNSDENESVGLEDEQQQDDNIMHPIKPIPKLREPSNARFDDVLRTTDKLFVLLHDKLTFLGLMDESDVVKKMELKDYSADKTIELLNYLENKGYLCTYEYEGRNILCFTELMWSCLNKVTLQNLIKRRFNFDSVQQCILYGTQDMEKDLFVAHLQKVDLYSSFIDKLNRSDAFTDLLPSSRWNSEERRYAIVYPYVDPNTGKKKESVLTLMSSEEYTECEVHAGDALICYSPELPLLDSITEKAFYMCLTDEGVYFINDDDDWEALAELGDDEDTGEAENKTPVVPEKVLDIPDNEEDKDELCEEQVQSNSTAVDTGTREEKEDGDKQEDSAGPELYLDDLTEEEPEPEKPVEETVLLSSVDMAKQLLDMAPVRDPSDEEMAGLIRKLLAEGERSSEIEHKHDQVVEAVVLAKLLSDLESYPICSAMYKQLQAAYPVFRESQGNVGLNLVSAFSTETSVSTSAKICAYIYNMLFPVNAHDHYFSSLYKTAFDEYDTQFVGFELLKNVYHKAKSSLERVPSGYTPANLAALADSKSQQERMNFIRKEAKQLLPYPLIRTHLSGMREVIDSSFGPQSMLHEALEGVVSNDTSLRDVIESEYLDFCDDEGDIDESKLDAYLDEQWNKCSKFKTPLKYEARKHVLNAFNERFSVIKEWLDVTASVAGPDVEMLRAFRADILKAIEEALDNLDTVSEAYDRNLIKASMESIRNKLQNMAPTEGLFSTMLRSGYFILVNGELVLNEDLNDVRFAEPWRNMLKHIMNTDYNLREVYQSILNADPHSGLYDNYFQLEQIGELIGADPKEYTLTPEIRKSAIVSANLEAKDFKDKLEISYAYNRISENVRERLAALADPELSDFNDFFYDHNAFGRWRSFLDALRAQIRVESQQRAKEVKRLLEQARETLKDDEPCQLLEEAEKLITKDQNFAVAEDYIHRFNNHERKIPYETSVGVKNYFLDFISDDVFNGLYSYCEKRKGSSLGKIGNSYLESNRPDGWTTRHFEDARQFLQKWPVDSQGTNNVPAFIGALGFVVENSQRYKRKNEVCFTLTVKRTEKNKADYRHPIAIFGTQMPRQIDVACLFGKRTANQLIDDACQLDFNRFFIVILDSTLALADRRKMAEYFFTQKNVGQASFLVIDRLLALYLALQPDSERLPALLQCALPYTMYQPFTNGSGTTADEMFFGRVSELASIRDMNGTSIVYGGRQLGKSALLERVEHLHNRPENREYAVRTTIREVIGVKAFLNNVIDACNKVFSGFSIKACETIPEFTSQIGTLLKEEKIAVLRLLIDESDSFLDSISGNNYMELQSLVDLQRDSSRRFKFVFAGLHDVCRAKNATKENGLFGQLGAPLCVKPLNPVDARNLLVRPLRYLGFKITNESQIDTILTNTNYYPGIIQFFGFTLVQTLASQYTQQYNAAKGNPPFELHDDQLASIMNSKDLNTEIKKRLRWTLEMDERYYMLARCVTVLYHMNDNSFQAISNGFATSAIREIADLFDIHCLTDLSEKLTSDLLDEMEEMGILSKPNSDEKRYLLRRRSFIDVIGPKLEELEKEIEDNNKEVKTE